jgi:hypothetical protein
MKFHLPSLQAAAHIASASQKERYPLRLVQVVRRPGGGHRYLAAWAQLMPIQRRREGIRGLQPSTRLS